MADTLTHTIDYNDVKESYLRAIRGEDIVKLGGNRTHLSKLVNQWRTKTSFYGPSSTEVSDWLHRGFRQPGLVLEPPIDPVRKKRRLRFAEEGELQIDLMYSGHDYPFLQWDKRDVMPGIDVNIRVNFVASTRVDIIIDYNRWVLRALIALEEAGIDLKVNLVTISRNMFSHDRGEILHQFITVKKVGEQSDYLAWSPMLSPGGFRHLIFMCYIIGSDKHGRVASNGLGRGTNTAEKWDVDFDNETGELNFTCPWSPYDFPEAEMEIRLRDVLAQARQAA